MFVNLYCNKNDWYKFQSLIQGRHMMFDVSHIIQNFTDSWQAC